MIITEPIFIPLFNMLEYEIYDHVYRSNIFPTITKSTLKLGKDQIINETLHMRVHLGHQQSIDVQSIPC